MAAAENFLSLFDEQGGYKNGDGEIEVIFLTRSGTEFPGKLRFKRGLLVGACRWTAIANGDTRMTRRWTG